MLQGVSQYTNSNLWRNVKEWNCLHVLLAQNVQSNVRELEGALIRLAAKSSLTGRPIDEEFARGELMVVSPRRPDLVSVEDIQKVVCSHFRLSNSELLSKDRHKSVAFARQVAMYLCRELTELYLPRIGQAFGGRDHTTVMHADRKIRQHMAERRSLYNQIAELTNRIKQNT